MSKMYYLTNGELPYVYHSKFSTPVRWKDDPKEYFKAYHSQNYLCECGNTIKVSSKYHHMKSLKHKYFMLQLQLNNQNENNN